MLCIDRLKLLDLIVPLLLLRRAQDLRHHIEEMMRGEVARAGPLAGMGREQGVGQYLEAPLGPEVLEEGLYRVLTLPNVEKRLGDDQPPLNPEAIVLVRKAFALISKRENVHVVMLVSTHMSRVMDGKIRLDPVKVDLKLEALVLPTRRTYHVGILLLERVIRAKHVYTSMIALPLLLLLSPVIGGNGRKS